MSTEDKEPSLENFEYIDFYKEQLNEIRMENENLKSNNESLNVKMQNIKSDCKILVGKICEENEILKEKIQSLSNEFSSSNC